MTFTKEEILAEFSRTRFVPLFTHDNPEETFQGVRIAYNAGVRTFEFTNRRPNSFATFSYLIKNRSEYPDLMLGIGTVMDAATTEKYINAGADFIISPIMKPEMAAVCRRRDTLWIPGCATLNEIVTANDLGAELVKLFPGNVLGPAFVSSIKPVVPDLKLLITGGVEPTRESITTWLGAGATCVGLGSKLFSSEIFEQKSWSTLEGRIRLILSVIHEFSNRK